MLLWQLAPATHIVTHNGQKAHEEVEMFKKRTGAVARSARESHHVKTTAELEHFCKLRYDETCTAACPSVKLYKAEQFWKLRC